MGSNVCQERLCSRVKFMAQSFSAFKMSLLRLSSYFNLIMRAYTSPQVG